MRTFLTALAFFIVTACYVAPEPTEAEAVKNEGSVCYLEPLNGGCDGNKFKLMHSVSGPDIDLGWHPSIESAVEAGKKLGCRRVKLPAED